MNITLTRISRTSEPSKLDTASLGTVCKVSNANGIEFYIQTSHNEENPIWILIDEDKIEEKLALLKEVGSI